MVAAHACTQYNAPRFLTSFGGENDLTGAPDDSAHKHGSQRHLYSDLCQQQGDDWIQGRGLHGRAADSILGREICLGWYVSAGTHTRRS